MKRMLLIAAAFCAAQAARADTAPMVQQPPPAVARIIAPERDGTSYGTGSLIAVNDYYGLVVTNWHVVRDAAGQIWVVFPGGFQSPATVMKADREWDLAALIVWKPNVQPLPVSTQAPQLGERLTIGGYGSGWYRAVSGRCIQYFSPGGNHPTEIVELSVPARNGDSGGPIFNDRGEIAGVLFGADDRSTMGSYCGRLRQFLAPLAGDFDRLPPPPSSMARQNPNSYSTLPVNHLSAIARTELPPTEKPQPIAQYSPLFPDNRENRARSIATSLPRTPVAKVASSNPRGMQAGSHSASTAATKTDPPQVNAAIPAAVATSDYDPPFDQLKGFLAVIGILALFIQCLKILGKVAS
ncbi:MAG: trypsin-like peptidase domain-containing protein [Pirellulales bacterium]|nr:trypsin-like peptidase domain-containing protein [Pirellulales bacterium]